MTDPEWMRCTVSQWEKKVELCLLEGKRSKANLYEQYAFARKLYDNGESIEDIQDAFTFLGAYPPRP